MNGSSSSTECGGRDFVGAADTLLASSGILNNSARPNSRTSARYRSITLAQIRSEGQGWEAIQEIFLASRPRFIRLAYSILRNKEDAEDAVQDALLSAYSHLNTFKGRSALTTWFTRIVLNAALVIRRKRKTSRINSFPESSNTDDIHWTETILASQPDPEMLYREKETFQLIDGLADEMSPILRQALRTTYYDEKSSNEACALLRVKKATFKSRLSRATRHASNGDAREALHKAGFHDAVRLPEFPTTVGRLPFRSAGCIDWIFVSDEVHSKGQVNDGIRASDHYPVLAKIEIS
jgi:RNA polymerase sigma-70 factor (ECF subfamily)